MESGIGWRELVILAAALAGVYLAVALWALWRLRRRKPVRHVDAEPTAADLGPAFKEPPPGHVWDHPFLSPVRLPDPIPEAPAKVDVVLEELATAAAEPAPPFAATLAVSEMEAELRQLRAEVERLRQELGELKQAPRISPLYADAAALAHRGFDAHGVAEECGISVAEAELVLAMSRDDRNFDKEVRDDATGH